MRIYSLYPSLLNDWQSFVNDEGYTKEDEHVSFIPGVQDMIDRINRVKLPTTEKQLAGRLFEDAVLGRIDVPEGTETPAILAAKKYIPPFGMDNKGCMGVYDFGMYQVVIYGLMDFVGGGQIIDLKRTGFYSLGKFYSSHQLWYLKNMQPYGGRSMSFVINHNNHIQVERYVPNQINWGDLVDQIEHFVEFIEDHKAPPNLAFPNTLDSKLIHNERIFQDVRKENWSNRSFGFEGQVQHAKLL